MLSVLFLTIIVNQTSSFSNDSLLIAVKNKAETMNMAYFEGNFDLYSTFLPDTVISAMGGKENLIKKISSDQLEGKGKVEDITISNLSDFVEETGSTALLMEVRTVVDFSGVKKLQKTYMIGFSEDSGETWKFYSSQCKAEQEKYIKAKFPNLVKTFGLPKCGTTQMPVTDE